MSCGSKAESGVKVTYERHILKPKYVEKHVYHDGVLTVATDAEGNMLQPIVADDMLSGEGLTKEEWQKKEDAAAAEALLPSPPQSPALTTSTKCVYEDAVEQRDVVHTAEGIALTEEEVMEEEATQLAIKVEGFNVDEEKEDIKMVPLTTFATPQVDSVVTEEVPVIEAPLVSPRIGAQPIATADKMQSETMHHRMQQSSIEFNRVPTLSAWQRFKAGFHYYCC